MPRAGGVYTLPAGNPVVTLTVISSGWANTTMADIATALTGSLAIDGSNVLIGALRVTDGTVGAPGLTWGSETTSGWYRIGLNDFGFSIAANKRLEVTANTLTVSVANGSGAVALSVLGGTTAGDSGLSVRGGTAAADLVAVFKNAAGTTTVGSLSATGAFSLGWNATAASLSGLAAGNLSVAAPSSGTAFSVNSIDNVQGMALNIVSASTGAYFGFLSSSVLKAAVGLGGVVGLGGGLNDFSILSTSGKIILGGAAAALTVANAGNITIAAPTSGVALTLTGVAGSQIGIFNGITNNSYFDYQRSGSLVGRVGSADSVAVGGVSTDFAISSPSGNLLLVAGSSAIRMTIGNNGNISIAAPVSGVALSIAGVGPSGNPVIDIVNGGSFTSAFRVGSNYVGTGTGTATLGGVKPGANTTNSSWLNILVGATQFYIPMWL